MKILYIAHRIPYPPNKGDKLRAFRQLEHLAGKHDVWCACFVDHADDLRYVRSMRNICKEVAAIPIARTRSLLRGIISLVTGGTVTESFYEHRYMRRLLASWTKTVNFDAVVAFSSGVAPYALTVPAARHVLDLCDLDSRKWLDYAATSRGPLRWLYGLEGRRLGRRERDWIERFDASILITSAEASSLMDQVPSSKIHIVGNGVDLPAMVGPADRSADSSDLPLIYDSQRARHAADREPTVGFIGVMDYRPNVDAVVWFVRQCWQGVRRVHPRAVFRIIGRRPTPAVSRLADSPGVHVIGEVESVRDELESIDVSVAPLRIARGLQNKVLEAMAHAKPVVLTGGAAEGIAGTDGKHFFMADTSPDMVRVVNRLLADPDERVAVGQAARDFVQANHTWRRELRKFEKIVTGIVDSRRSDDADLTVGARAANINSVRADLKI